MIKSSASLKTKTPTCGKLSGSVSQSSLLASGLHAFPSLCNREMIQEQSNDMEELVARLETSEESNKELRSTVQTVRSPTSHPFECVVIINSTVHVNVQSEEAVADLQEKLNAQESRQISDPNTPRKQVRRSS